jgi:hypothetical protein
MESIAILLFLLNYFLAAIFEGFFGALYPETIEFQMSNPLVKILSSFYSRKHSSDRKKMAFHFQCNP